MDALEKGKMPIFRILLPFLLGTWLGIDISWSAYLSHLFILTFSSLAAFLLLNLEYKRAKIYRKRWLGGLSIYITLFGLGIIQTEFYKELNHEKHFSYFPADHLLICVNEEPKLSGDILRFSARVRANGFKKDIKSSRGTLLIALKTNTQSTDLLKYGDLIWIKSHYLPTEPPYNPAEFNYKRYLQHQNIYYQTFINNYQFVSSNAGNALVGYAISLRKQMVDRFNRYMTDPDAIAVASTLILGYRADLSQEVLQAYSKTGTTHVLSVSGMHVALIFVMINVLLKFLNRYRRGVIVKAVLSILLIWFYALLTGFSAAVCRAAVMITFVIVGKAYRKKINMLNLLAISAFLLLLYNPLYLADVGFQLSYLAIFGLIYLQPIVYELLHFNNWLQEKIWSICSVSIAAQVITFPLCMLYFHQFPIYFLISNIFIILPSTIIMSSGVTLLVSSYIPGLQGWFSQAIAWILEKTIILMNNTLHIIENLPFSSWNKIWINSWENILLYVVIALLFAYIKTHKKLIYIKLLFLSILILSINISWKTHQSFKNKSIHLFSLRKNTAIAIQTGKSMVLISDLKPDDKTYRFSIQPYVDSSKITQLTLLNFDQDIIRPNLVKKGNLIQFGQQTLCIFDPLMAKKKLPSPLKINYLYITKNPKISLKKLMENYEFDLLIVDGTNSDKLISALYQQAESLGISNKILKRNISLSLPSN